VEETSATLDQLNDAKDVQRCACVRTIKIAAKVQKQRILPQSTGTLGLRFPRDISFLRKKTAKIRSSMEKSSKSNLLWIGFQMFSDEFLRMCSDVFVMDTVLYGFLSCRIGFQMFSAKVPSK